jgi:hypothetical protein
VEPQSAGAGRAAVVPGPSPVQPRVTRAAARAGSAATAATAAAAGANGGGGDVFDEGVRLDLLTAAEQLRAELASLRMPLSVPGVDAARAEHEALIAQLDDYLLPRLRRMDAPVLAVVGGSTGAGKSTLVNSLCRREVTRSGVLRPTTRSPVLVHNPYDSGAFLSQRVLPGLARVTSEAPEPMQPVDLDAPPVTALRLVPHDGVPAGVAILDAPDIDSLVEANRDLAVQLLAAADLWVFVTTAARYGDAIPWELLRQAVDRGVSVAIVLDRVPPAAMQTVRMHLATLLRDRGLGTSPMFTIPETGGRSDDGFLPFELVAPLMGWLRRIAKDSRSRDIVVRRTLIGVLDSLQSRVSTVATAADDQVGADERLRDDLDEVYAAAAADLERDLGDGTLLRGELLARWQEFTGSGAALRSLDGGRTAIPELDDAVQRGVRVLVRSSVHGAAEAATTRWRLRTAGGPLMDRHPIEAAVFESDERVAHMARDWQLALAERVASALSRRRGGAPDIAPDVAAAIAAIAVFGSRRRPDSDDAVPSTATKATVAARKVLSALIGDADADALVDAARDDLVIRAGTALDADRCRVEAVLDAVGVRDGRGARLRRLVEAIDGAR